MAEFCLRIAGHTAAIRSLFDSAPDFLRAYVTEETPAFSIAVTPEDLAQEQELALEEARLEGFRIRYFPDPFLERAVIQRKFADFLFQKQILLFHGSALALDGNGYLFTARSGTGKSTHTRYWRESFPGRVQMINDDKPFLDLGQTPIQMYGSPWSGKHGLDTNICVPLKGLCILERGTENRIHPVSAEEALPMLSKQAHCPLNTPDPECHRKLVHTLALSIPLWHMTCTKSPESALVAAQAMTEI